MYTTIGLIYRGAVVGGVLFLSSAVLLVFAFLGKKTKFKDYIVAFIALLLGIALGGYFFYKAANPVVLCHEGMLTRENSSKVFLTYEYAFSNSNGLKPVLYLDTFSKKKIYPNELYVGETYRIYYEKDTRVILKIELISEGQGDGSGVSVEE